MGCLKLPHIEEKSHLKIIHSSFEKTEKLLGECRYGFNGMEKDDELKGSGNSYDFGARIYDSRLGRWFSTDVFERKYPNISPYCYSGDSPILFGDYNGKDFGIIFDHKNKTIIITANYYTTSKKAYKQALKAVKQWNEKTATVAGYEVSFDLKVKEPFEPTEKDVLEFAGSQKDDLYKNNGQLKMSKFNKLKKKMIANRALSLSARDPIGNVYHGNSYKDSETVRGEGYTAGITSGGELIYMHTHLEKGDLGDKEDVVAHEIGHTLGLDDKGKGPYYKAGGIMEYEYDDDLNMQEISDDDVRLIVDFAMDVLAGKTDGSVKLITEVIEKMESRTVNQLPTTLSDNKAKTIQ